MTERRDEQIVAVLYQLGGRHREPISPEGRVLYAADLCDDGSDTGTGPLSQESARAVYEVRRAARVGRTGGERHGR